jgi:hypothetical protein
MPREPNPLIRPGGFKEAEKLFILAYEGSVSEKKYFNDFRYSDWFNDSGIIEVIPLERPKNAGNDPISVKNLLKKAKSKFPFKPTDEFWLIIDRDHWENIHNINFATLVQECKNENNFFLAMSNPCFEIWLLLHLKDINEFSADDKQLIFENPKIGSKKHYIDKVIEAIQGRGYDKSPNPRVYLPNIKIAIQRAKDLNINDEDYPTQLGSHIYKIIEKLIKED